MFYRIEVTTKNNWVHSFVLDVSSGNSAVSSAIGRLKRNALVSSWKIFGG